MGLFRKYPQELLAPGGTRGHIFPFVQPMTTEDHSPTGRFRWGSPAPSPYLAKQALALGFQLVLVDHQQFVH